MIFLLEMRTLLSLLETSANDESEIRQRAWMLRSLITHVNTENVMEQNANCIFQFLY